MLHLKIECSSRYFRGIFKFLKKKLYLSNLTNSIRHKSVLSSQKVSEKILIWESYQYYFGESHFTYKHLGPSTTESNIYANDFLAFSVLKISRHESEHPPETLSINLSEAGNWFSFWKN